MTESKQNAEHFYGPIPDTGISGLYEVMLGVDDLDYAQRYFSEFGFTAVQEGKLSASEAKALYGVDSALTAYRWQNGEIDSHGLLRFFVWEKPLGPGVGYAPPETIGQRLAVMRTEDIFRLHDIYTAARENGEQWFATHPIADDLFDLDVDKKSFFSKPIIVRENAIWGDFFNHIFFQRYGYVIPGYGTIGDHSNLKTSEITHNDFIIAAKDIQVMSYLSTALGLQAEEAPALDGDWQKGPKAVFHMSAGDSHWYQGFVSPNNICGKLKFFVPTTAKPDRSEFQKVGHLGITMHSFYTDKLSMVHGLVSNHQLKPTKILKNEFRENCFTFSGPGGCHWQIIEKSETRHQPTRQLTFDKTKH